ncbi:TPA: hypothetical protein ACPV0H_004681 [Vibrio parahaemolyticus]|nr:hypothetical protein [Vibrio parahaemolyticus]
MHIVFSFKTSMFNVTTENKNPINPIYGESLLKWLKQEVGSEFTISEPEAEDWGWCCYIFWGNRQYMLGALTYYEEGDDPTIEQEWIFQIVKHRTLMEKLLRKENISSQDECVLFLKSKFEAEPRINSIVIE